MLKHLLCFVLASSLMACQNLPSKTQQALPLPHLEEVMQFQIEHQHKQALLVLEALSDQQWRFVYVDTLGMPIARQNLSSDGGFEIDGFLPPNSQARALFTAVYVWVLSQKGLKIPQAYEGVRIEPLSADSDRLSWKGNVWILRKL